MAAITQRGNKFQIRVKHKLLSKPFFFTFDGESAARDYASKLEAMLNRGIVPVELLEQNEATRVLVSTVLNRYLPSASASDKELISYVSNSLDPKLVLSSITSRWCDQWIEDMKTKRLAPGSIRKRAGCLARAIDAYCRVLPAGHEPISNPLRLLPMGYSQYKGAEHGADVPVDTERDRILSADELKRIDETLTRLEARTTGRNKGDPDFAPLFWLIYRTGLRLRTAYTLETSQIDTERHLIIFKDRGTGNKRKPRFVPIQPALRAILYSHILNKSGLIFHYWTGDPLQLDQVTNRLKQRFRTLFDLAKVEDFTEHDLRHCATTNWLQMKSAQGHWLFSETEVIKIMGWTSSKMLLRYASIRGEDFSNRFD
jgi:integrase